MDRAKEDMKVVGVREEDADDSYLETGGHTMATHKVKGRKAERKRRKIICDTDSVGFAVCIYSCFVGCELSSCLGSIFVSPRFHRCKK